LLYSIVFIVSILNRVNAWRERRVEKVDDGAHERLFLDLDVPVIPLTLPPTPPTDVSAAETWQNIGRNPAEQRQKSAELRQNHNQT